MIKTPTPASIFYNGSAEGQNVQEAIDNLAEGIGYTIDTIFRAMVLPVGRQLVIGNGFDILDGASLDIEGKVEILNV